MAGPTGPVLVLLLLLVVVALSSCATTVEEPDTVVVSYKQRTMTVPRGSSVKLSCEVQYVVEKCDLLHVAWLHSSKQHAEMTDPRKFLTTVNETESEGIVRRRQVVTEILDLGRQDNGDYQCRAECEGGGESAMGHFISISVKGRSSPLTED